MNKSIKYIIAISLLLVVNLWLFFSNTNSTKSPEKYFDPEELDGVSGFTFIGEQDTVRLSLTTEGWMINDEYAADQKFVNNLISILKKIEVGGMIENWDRKALGSVKITFDSKEMQQFQFASNLNKTRSYFITENGAKEVSVPGYRDNAVDIFMLHPDQWRNRIIVDGSWRTIQNIEVKNELGEDFQIVFDDKFFLVNGEQPTDSSAVVNYLNQFQQFQANEMISPGRFAEMDSIATAKPFAQILLDDIKNENALRLQIFSNKKGQSYHLVIDQDGNRMVIDAKRINQILSNPN